MLYVLHELFGPGIAGLAEETGPAKLNVIATITIGNQLGVRRFDCRDPVRQIGLEACEGLEVAFKQFVI